MGEAIVCEEVAYSEFARLCAERRISLDETDLDKNDLEKLDTARRQIVTAIMQGTFTVEEKGQATYTPPEGKPIVFYRATGATLISSDDAPEGKNAAKLASVMAAMTKTPRGELSKLDIADFNFCITVTNLFLGAGR